ncbi:MAG: 2OG-Fe(II) oxygenase [Eudoraea sp.]|nr:2OG-Fe(II) oxygenase [Eudoraea sp.]
MKSLYYLFFDFLGKEENQALYNLAIEKNDRFSDSNTIKSKLYPNWRKSKVIYHQQFAYFEELMKQKLRERFDEICKRLNIAPFDINYMEVQLTSHNDGEYFKWHSDNSSADTATRTITFVYYFHALPKRYSGGELVIHEGLKRHVITPENDTMVVFYSGRNHEVKKVRCPSGRFEDGRFTLNGWIRAHSPIKLKEKRAGLGKIKRWVAKIGS